MHDLLAQRPPWFIVGPGIGVIVVILIATLNARIGVLGGYSELVGRITGDAPRITWRGPFVIGVVIGAGAFALTLGQRATNITPTWIHDVAGSVPIAAIAVPALFCAGMLIGFGAKRAGGCTSGNGIGGCCLASPASMTATMTFMATAIVATFAIDLLTGSL